MGHATTAFDKENNLVEEDMKVARLFLFADWPEKYFSGQSEGGISNASGTRSIRVSAQGLSRSCCQLSPMKIPSSRLAAPGSPRMIVTLSQPAFNYKVLTSWFKKAFST